MTDYAGYWQPQSLEEAMWHIDTGHTKADDFWQWGKNWARKLEMYAGRNCPEGVLDYGCGVGRVIYWMDSPARVGVDVSMAMLNLAQEHMPGPVYVLGDGRTIPLPDESMGFVYSLLTLQHMDGPDAASIVKEAYRVLKPGGHAYLQFSGFGGQPYKPDMVVKRGTTKWVGKREGSKHGAHDALDYSRADLDGMARAAGFELFEIIDLKDAGMEGNMPYHAIWGRKQAAMERAAGGTDA